MTHTESINTGLECKFYNEENMSKDKDKDISLKIVVSGTEITLEANPHQTLGSLIEKVLKKAGEASQPDQWGYFVQKGGEMVPVDSNMKAEDAAKQHGLLYLNKKAGAAG
ncbi:DUF2604 domain-containing protein [Candidatus Ferrigenium straubiae]|jgi:hypothetical protein|uniref:DUF2604 domain-containing protein n=1 Tax=Candidatus Ferrigenium straubiae TaxID=2919506 RepID=UPI003F4AB705